MCVCLCAEYVRQEMPRERTFIMIKPDGVQRGLVAKIIERFEQKGFKLVCICPNYFFPSFVESDV